MGALFARDSWRWPGRHMRLLARLDDNAATPDRGAIFEYALSLAFLLPLLFGVFSAVKSQRMTVETDGLAHDLVHMYKQGVDFSAPANRVVALELARARGLPLGGSSGTAILSRVHVENGVPVFDQQVVIGRAAGHRSQIGTPAANARANLSGEELKPGASVWICELWFAAPDQPGGIYVRVSD